MHRRPSLFKACVFLFAASAAAMGVAQAADSKLDSVLARGKLIVGTGSTNAPWHFQGADGKLQGFDIDIGHIIAKGLFNDPAKVEYVVQSSDARIPNLLTDKVDISCQFITVTASRAQQVAFTLPYYREGVGLLLPTNSKYKEIEDMKAAGDSVTVYQAVNSGRADAAATDQSSVKYLMVQNPGRYRSPAYAWSPQTYACAVKRGDQDWLNFVNTTLHEAMTGVEFPAYAASFKQWFGVYLPTPAIGFPVEFK
jgi:polar amino acid transport system substrate-binding protein